MAFFFTWPCHTRGRGHFLAHALCMRLPFLAPINQKKGSSMPKKLGSHLQYPPLQPAVRAFPLKPLCAMLAGLGWSGLAALGMAGAAHAQSAATLSPVVVEGQAPGEIVPPTERRSPKATAPLLNTPQTVVAIPEQVYHQQGARDLADVLRNTPGITYNGGENGFATGSSNFSLRGFESGGSVYIDNVRDSGNYNRDIFNIESVEVVKGPAGDNGRGTAGGYVNLVTKTPHRGDAFGGTVSYGFDRYDSEARKRATLDLNKAFSDSVAARINLLAEDSGVPGRDEAERNTVGIAPSISFGLGTPTRGTLAYSYLKANDLPDFGVPSALVPGFSPSGDTLRHDQLERSVSRDNFYGHADDYDRVEQNVFTGRIEHDFSDRLTLSNQLRHATTDRDALYTVVANLTQGAPDTVQTQRQNFQRKNTALSNLTNLTARFETGGLKHTLSTGVELMQEESRSGRNAVNLGNPGTTNLYDPDPYRPIAGPVDTTPTTRDRVKINTAAAYLYDTVEFNPQWQATGGVRLERYKATIDSNDVDHADGYKSSDTTLNGSLGIVYKPLPQASIYGSVGVSTLPPGSFLSTPDISRPGNNAFPTLGGQNNPDAKAQRATSYELGTKWSLLDNRLSASAAVFQIDRRNIGMTDGDEFLGYGKQQVRGIELGVAGAITPAWSVFGGATYQKSKRTHSAAIDAALRAASPGDYGDALSTSGDELAFTPKLMANLWTTYRFPIGLTLGVGMQYVGKSYVGRPDNVDRVVKNGVNGEMPSYVVFNAMAAYEVNKNLTLRLNVDNIADKLYASSVNWSARRVQLGVPRTFLLSADFRY